MFKMAVGTTPRFNGDEVLTHERLEEGGLEWDCCGADVSKGVFCYVDKTTGEVYWFKAREEGGLQSIPHRPNFYFNEEDVA